MSLSERRADSGARYGADSIEVRALHRVWENGRAAHTRLDPDGRLVAI